MNYHFFYGSFLSQWHACKFVVHGVHYNNAEQYMMAAKAYHFSDIGNMRKIMDSESPRDQKAYGRMVKNFNADAWNEIARDVVFRGNYAKFSQNKQLLSQLLETGDKELVEASPYDRIWGIGLSMSDPDRFDKSKWKGTNWLGETLTRVRDELRKERADCY